MRWGYLHLPRFAAQRRGVEQPALAGRPFALVEEVRGTRRVAAASAGALEAGVRAGMALSAACALAPGLQVFAHAPEAERRALAALGEALLALAPGFQLPPVEGTGAGSGSGSGSGSADGLWLDAGAAHLCGGEEAWAQRVLEVAAAQGLRGRVAVAPGAFPARALARHGARAVECVSGGDVARALAPLPLGALERPRAEADLRALGLTTLGEVARLPLPALVARGGAEAARVHARCRGEDDTPFVPHPPAEVCEEALQLEWPAESLEPLQFALKTVLDRLGARLAGRGRAAVRLLLTLRLDPTGEARVTLTLSRPTAAARLLLELAKHRLSELTLEAPVAGLCVRVEEACEDRGQQLVLGDGPQGDAALEVVLSRLATALGEGALFSAGLAPVHRPEAAYTCRAFRPPRAERGLVGELLGTAPGGGGPPGAALPDAVAERPARLLARPAPLDAEVGPAGELLHAHVAGRRRRATLAQGPERVGGEWWSDTPYTRDYFRVHLEGLGLAWVFRDARDGRFYLQGLFD